MGVQAALELEAPFFCSLEGLRPHLSLLWTPLSHTFLLGPEWETKEKGLQVLPAVLWNMSLSCRGAQTCPPDWVPGPESQERLPPQTGSQDTTHRVIRRDSGLEGTHPTSHILAASLGPPRQPREHVAPSSATTDMIP